MAPHSSPLAWKIPWTEEPGRLQSMGSLRVGHDRATSLSLFTFMHWRRKWQPTPVFLPGESQGWGSLVGCCLWGHTESDTTEATQQQQEIGCNDLFPPSFFFKIKSPNFCRTFMSQGQSQEKNKTRVSLCYHSLQLILVDSSMLLFSST